MGGGWETRSRMQDLEKDAFWRAKVSNLMRGAVGAYCQGSANLT
jgi:hypothetical protein